LDAQKLTKSRVDSLKAPASGQAFFRDAILKGFALRVTTSGAKSFVVEKRIEGRVKRITVGLCSANIHIYSASTRVHECNYGLVGAIANEYS
jgi:hypothetical protein